MGFDADFVISPSRTPSDYPSSRYADSMFRPTLSFQPTAVRGGPFDPKHLTYEALKDADELVELERIQESSPPRVLQRELTR